MEKLFGLIGGTGLDELGAGLKLETSTSGHWGNPSDVFTEYRIGDVRFLFLPRHGYDHRFAPHRINYRANIMAFKAMGVKSILAVNAVGNITESMPPGSLVLADQIIDSTWGRGHTFFEDDQSEPTHIEFAEPFSERFRQQVLMAAELVNIKVHDKGTLAVTQGPRLETAAEVQKLKRDGCDLVGMTTMPEAALAREADIEYASLCVVGNLAAGLGSGGTIEGMEEILVEAMQRVRLIISALS